MSAPLLVLGAAAADFTGLVGWVVDVISAMGAIGVGLLLALDNILPIVPSEVVLPFAGYLTAQGEMGFWLTLVAATVGSTGSAYVYYEAGRRLGPDRARTALEKLPLTDRDDIDRATGWFERHGQAAVLTGRMVPLVRSMVSLPAGTEGMGRVRFGLLTAAGRPTSDLEELYDLAERLVAFGESDLRLLEEQVVGRDAPVPIQR